MNMIGSVRHVQKALDAGADMICAQGGEGGGHTGEVATTVLLPQVVDMCSKKISTLTGGPVMVVGAYGNLFIILGPFLTPFSRLFQSYTTSHAPAL